MYAIVFNLIVYLYCFFVLVATAITVWYIGLKLQYRSVHYFLAPDKREYKMAIKTYIFINGLYCSSSIFKLATRLFPHVVPYANSSIVGWEVWMCLVYAVQIQFLHMMINNADFHFLNPVFWKEFWARIFKTKKQE